MEIPEEACVVRLARIDRAENLLLCEAIQFKKGWKGVHTVLRRAQISGRVEVEGKIENHFADLLNINGDMVATVALDARSYSALKNKWMRTRLQPAELG